MDFNSDSINNYKPTKKVGVDIKNNSATINSVDRNREADIEIRRAAIQHAVAIAKKYGIHVCECCGKKNWFLIIKIRYSALTGEAYKQSYC